jgi:hypothetical protein
MILSLVFEDRESKGNICLKRIRYGLLLSGSWAKDAAMKVQR